MPEADDRAAPPQTHAERGLSPVGWLRGEHHDDIAEDGIALCLSGGGYRAMLFHVGSLWRLSDAGLLRQLDCISSVSGGSLSAATLAVRWDRLEFGPDGRAQNFDRVVVEPIRVLAQHTLDV